MGYDYFTHYGLFCGCIPVYIRDPDGDCELAARYYLPDFLIDLAACMFEFVANTMGNDSGWPLTIYGEIK